MKATTSTSINLDRLLNLRLVVARFGEMDNAGWWNTNGMLSRLGKVALRRGFPKTHAFAQARAVFAVARHRCQEVFDPPRCLTLWKLPADVEDQFEMRWSDWIDEADRWSDLFDKLELVGASDLLSVFQGLELAGMQEIGEARKLKRSLDNRAVQIPGVHTPNDKVLTQLALGFFRGDPGSPAIPYARLEE